MSASPTPSVVLVTESSAAVGTGHLREMQTLAGTLVGRGVHPILVVNRGAVERLLRQTPCPVVRFARLDASRLNAAAAGWARQGAGVLVTNLRRVTAAQIRAVTDHGLMVLSIDERGGRALPCDAIINPLPVASRHRYGRRSRADVHAGLPYLSMQEEFVRLRRRSRTYRGPIRRLLVTMGGADRSGATLRVVRALTTWSSGARREVIIGAANARRAAVAAACRGWRVLGSQPSIAASLRSADVVICAGGNTLFEAACAGTPAIVLHEDRHEGESARAMARRGFGVALGSNRFVSARRLRAALDGFEDPAVRRAHGRRGRELVDGAGASRLADLVERYLELTNGTAGAAAARPSAAGGHI